MDTGVYSNLEVLNECLNGMSKSSSMLIINKVPTEKTLERRRQKGEKHRDREIVLDETLNEVSKALNITFKYKCFLENEELDGAEEFNLKEYNTI